MVDYAFYVNCYLGSAIPEKAFSGVAAQAQAYLDRLKGCCRVESSGAEAESMALCAMAESLWARRGSGLTSASVGSVSVHYAETKSSLPRELYEKAAIYLDIYRGGEGMILPVDYSMCCQTVTVYRKTPAGIVRTELPGCHIQWQEETSYDRLGRQQERKFLLIQPGEGQQVFPGDRVMEGIGPEITQAQWPAFVSELVAGLGEVAYAKAYYWQGGFCHTEAGRK